MTEHRFNTDIGIRKEDRQLAETRWPSLATVLFDDDLLRAVTQFEGVASTSKKRVHTAGTIAIAFAVLALSGAACDLYGIRWLSITSMAFSAMAVLSFVLAWFASRFSPWRQQWVVSRFAVESLRAWYFRQLLSSRLEHACAGSDEQKLAYLDQRRRDLSNLLTELHNAGAARMTSFIHDSLGTDAAPEQARLPRHADLRRSVLDAFLTLRLRHQLDYAAHKVSVGDKTFLGLSGALLSRASDMIAVTSLCTSIVLAILSTIPSVGHARELGVLTLLLAITAVGIRAWRDGMALEADLETYHEYRRRLVILHAKWVSSTDAEACWAIAQDVEAAAQVELRAFLKAHQGAQFLF